MTSLADRLRPAFAALWDPLRIPRALPSAAARTYIAVDVDRTRSVAAVAWAFHRPDIARIAVGAHIVTDDPTRRDCHNAFPPGVDVRDVLRGAIDTLGHNTHVVEVAGDPRYACRLLDDLERDGVATADLTAPRHIELALEDLYTAGVSARLLAHDGDPVVNGAIANTMLETSPFGLRATKLSPEISIAAVYAIAIAFSRCLTANESIKDWFARLERGGQ